MTATTTNPELGLTSLLPRHIPTLSYTIQNILISLVTLVASTASLLFTLCVVLPLSMMRAGIPGGLLVPRGRAAQNMRARGCRVVLVVGASRGIGFGVLKQYMNDPDVVIVAASRSVDVMRKSLVNLGPTIARIECVQIDFSASKKHIAEALQSIDNEHGPVTHMYTVSAVWNQRNEKDATGIRMDTMADAIKINISGTVACVLTMYEIMKARGHGKICIVGTPALSSTTNMISVASTKSFLNAFSTSLRVLAAPSGVEVVSVQPGVLDARPSMSMHGQNLAMDCTKDTERLARRMKDAVECGGEGVVCWPVEQGVVMRGLEGVNPICEELAKWMSMGMMKKRAEALGEKEN
ncbi:hypothetical protein GALMADRAFT_213572 [Galerina marginata CBS 339.88]|uniref:NAD(P)-binding protein n=1 Tax=Galerina marginata (strain CBS 339.88) TaxID=685588 RepID=A0A067SMH7_GALM3|nr:hypothetical protein GALMADRAFT_213572 [Galerina marginata CBS 339.88]